MHVVVLIFYDFKCFSMLTIAVTIKAIAIIHLDSVDPTAEMLNGPIGGSEFCQLCRFAVL